MSAIALSLDGLIAAYLAAKEAEAQATARRQEIADELASCFEVPPEGAKTHTTELYKVTLRGAINRKVDWDALDRVLAAYPNISPPVKTKRELDTLGLRYYAEHDPELYKALASAITSTPGRVGIEIKPKGDSSK